MMTAPWNVSSGQLETILRALRFRYYKWDTYACGSLKILPETIVLGPQEHSEIVEIGERLAGVLNRLEAAVKRDQGLAATLGIPGHLVPMIQSEAGTPLQIARYDLFPTVEGGWAVSEFNEDVPGGFNEAVGMPELLADAHPGCSFPGNFAEAFLDALPAEGTVALMYATGYSEDLQHMLVLESLLRGRGQGTVLCSPGHLGVRRGMPSVDGEAIRSVVRFYPGEWFPLLPNVRTWRRLLPDLRMMNPLGRLIRQSKRLFALWRMASLVDEEDQTFLDRLAPETEFFEPSRHVSLLRREKPDWVLKQAFGRMGDAVVMGRLVKDAEWEQALREAEKQPEQFLVQRCFRVAPLRFSSGVFYPTIGVFVINGRFAGYYSRVSPIPFLTHEASYVPTVVAAA